MSNSYDSYEDKYLRTEKNFKSMVRLFRDIFHWKKDATTVTISVIISSIAGVLYPLALGLAVNAVLDGNVKLLLFYAAIFFGLYIVMFFSNRSRTRSSTKIAQLVIKRLRDSSFKRLQNVPIDFYGKIKAGYLISRIANDSESISDFLTYQLPQVISGIVTVVIAAIIMLYLNTLLTLYSLIILPVLGVFTISVQGLVRKNYLRTRKTIAAITGSLAETIAAIRTVKAFNAEEHTEEGFEKLNYDNLQANLRASLLSSSYGAVIRIIEAIGIVIVLYEGSLALLNNAISLGILVSFVVYVQEFFDPIVQLSQIYNSYQNSLVGSSRIYGIIDSAIENDSGSLEIPSFSSSLNGMEIGVKYDENIALDKVTVTIKKGERVAIVGRTGAGKTTLTNVILKFKLPDKGDILVDGEDLLNVDTTSFREIIAPVLQEPFLFNGSIYENVEFAKRGTTKEEIMSVINKFGMKDIYDSLSNGLDSQVGEMGRNLSEGQRQAVSMLRAFIRNPEIIVMDEATAQIDTESEKNIIRALRNYMKNGTLIIISHRFSLVTLADRIIVLEKGRIVQEGTLDELSRQGGTFAELYKTSLGSRK